MGDLPYRSYEVRFRVGKFRGLLKDPVVYNSAACQRPPALLTVVKVLNSQPAVGCVVTR